MSSSVCVYILVFCIFITFYFRSHVPCGLWVPLFVFIFLYFVSRSPFILDLLCLVDCYKIQEDKHKQSNPQSTRHKRSKIKGDLDTKYKKINTNRGTHSPQDTRDLFCIFITFYFRSLVSCGLWVPLFVFIFL
jgi:hypothetical protein